MWILGAVGVALVGCCFLSVALLGLGALTGDASPTEGPRTTTSVPAGSEYRSGLPVERGTSLTQSLPDGRWVNMSGSNVDHVVARAGSTQWVQTNTSGAIHELTFDDDGNYAWLWSAGLTMNGARFESNCTEKGTWTLSGTQLTLQPDSQAAEYTNSSGTQEKTDQDLTSRRYELLDVTLETMESNASERKRFPAMTMNGPKAAWDTGSGGVSMTLQRLTN